MKRSIQLVALLLTVFMGSCTGGKDKAAAEHVDAKPIVKLADVKARPVDQIQDYTATVEAEVKNNIAPSSPVRICLLYTSDAADEEDSVDFGGCRLIKKKKKKRGRGQDVSNNRKGIRNSI